ncbi:MAG: homoserine kinase [candidate division Zixibacteria bacterium]|nr:homoserine kinase [candidate division Zixibacteria bacterium]
MTGFSVKVPSTTGNLGSGFDCVGMALGLHNTVQARETSTGLWVEIEGEGASLVPADASNLCVKAAYAVFDRTGYRPTGLHFKLRHAIPVSRGLGSSGVAIVAGAVAANEIAGRPLDTAGLLRICSDLEGHPDNVVPSLLGGLSISGERDGVIVYRTFEIPVNLMAVVAIPEFTLDTKVARGALPSNVSLSDAVFNLCSVGLLVGALVSGDYGLLRHGMADRLHQPYRKPLIPGLGNVIEAALDTGAHGAALSGAGPTAIALSTQNHREIGEAMVSAFAQSGVESHFRILAIDNDGTTVSPL